MVKMFYASDDGKTALAIATHHMESNGEGTIIAVESRKQEILAGCAQIIEILKLHSAQMH
jgi:hypothetical protein